MSGTRSTVLSLAELIGLRCPLPVPRGNNKAGPLAMRSSHLSPIVPQKLRGGCRIYLGAAPREFQNAATFTELRQPGDFSPTTKMLACFDARGFPRRWKFFD